MSRKTLIVAVGAAALVLGLGAGAGAQYPTPTPAQNDVRCNQPTDFVVEQGDPISTVGEAGCFAPFQPLEMILFSHPVTLARFEANDDGSYTAPTRDIPADMEAGRHILTVRGAVDGTPSYEREITVEAAGAAGGAAGRLPRTGGQIAFLALWAVALISFGSALIAFTWKRWRAARTEDVLLEDTPHLPMLEPGSDIDDLRATYGTADQSESTGPQVLVTIGGGAIDEHPDEVTQTVQRDAFSLESATSGRTPQDVVADLERQIASWRTKK